MRRTGNCLGRHCLPRRHTADAVRDPRLAALTKAGQMVLNTRQSRSVYGRQVVAEDSLDRSEIELWQISESKLRVVRIASCPVPRRARASPPGCRLNVGRAGSAQKASIENGPRSAGEIALSLALSSRLCSSILSTSCWTCDSVRPPARQESAHAGLPMVGMNSQSGVHVLVDENIVENQEVRQRAVPCVLSKIAGGGPPLQSRIT